MHDRTLNRKYHNSNIWISHNIPMNAIQNRNFIGMYGLTQDRYLSTKT